MLKSAGGIFLAGVIALMTTSTGESRDVNYDENKVPAYTLPDPLVCQDGTRVEDSKAWRTERRPEVLRLFEKHVYGRMPGRPAQASYDVLDEDEKALEGKARRKEVRCTFTNNGETCHLDLLMYLPAKGNNPVPVFLGLNFFGNHSIHADPGIALNAGWMRSRKGMGVVDNRATEASRGKSSSRWPVELIVARGYGVFFF